MRRANWAAYDDAKQDHRNDEHDQAPIDGSESRATMTSDEPDGAVRGWDGIASSMTPTKAKTTTIHVRGVFFLKHQTG